MFLIMVRKRPALEVLLLWLDLRVMELVISQLPEDGCLVAATRFDMSSRIIGNHPVGRGP